jgi:hypothetical protein
MEEFSVGSFCRDSEGGAVRLIHREGAGEDVPADGYCAGSRAVHIDRLVAGPYFGQRWSIQLRKIERDDRTRHGAWKAAPERDDHQRGSSGGDQPRREFRYFDIGDG